MRLASPQSIPQSRGVFSSAAKNSSMVIMVTLSMLVATRAHGAAGLECLFGRRRAFFLDGPKDGVRAPEQALDAAAGGIVVISRPIAEV